jgi:hypothetical protein
VAIGFIFSNLRLFNIFFAFCLTLCVV